MIKALCIYDLPSGGSFKLETMVCLPLHEHAGKLSYKPRLIFGSDGETSHLWIGGTYIESPEATKLLIKQITK